jgi:branched-chain amino acid aminotransferase
VKVWLDGRIVGGEEARIPVTDHGLLYGDGVFEGIRVCARGVFRLDDHLARLAASARALALELPEPLPALREIVLATARAFGEPDAYVRLIVTRGEGALGVDPTTCRRGRVICIVDRLAIYPPRTLARGLDLVTASLRRPAPDVLDPRVKSLNYLNSALAKLEARQRGADEALLLNAAGNVAEASVANVFAICGDLLRTPPPSEGALEGITRRTVLELAPVMGLRQREEPLGRQDLFQADEVFLTGTGAGVAGVRSLDGRSLRGPAPGPLTDKLARAYLERVRSEGVPV